jgi:hypothetical protein
MTRIRDGKVRARERIAVLAALNLALSWPTAKPPSWRLRRTSPCRRCSPHGHHRYRCGNAPQSTERLQALVQRIDEAGQRRAPALNTVIDPQRLQWQRLRCCRALYFLEPMLIEPGLVHCLVSVIVSRQMNPTSGCPRP